MSSSSALSRRAALAGLGLAFAAPSLAGPSTVLAAGIVDPLRRPALKTPRAARALLLAAARVGPRRLAAAGERGVIVLSDDGGATWRQATVPVSVTLTALHFPNPNDGWAAGHDGAVLHSGDGGETWIKQFDGDDANRMTLADAESRIAALKAEAADAAGADEDAAFIADDAKAAVEFGPSRPLLSVWFRDRLVGYAAGSYGQIFQTRDGGKSWRSLALRIDNPDGLHYAAVGPAPGGGVLLAGEGGRVCLSWDEGESWRVAVASAQTPLYGAAATADGGLLAYGFGGRMFRSADRGESWTLVQSPTFRTLAAAATLDDGALALADAGGGVIVSRDGGRSFAQARPPGLAPTAGAAAAGPGSLLLTGVGGARVVTVA